MQVKLYLPLSSQTLENILRGDLQLSESQPICSDEILGLLALQGLSLFLSGRSAAKSVEIALAKSFSLARDLSVEDQRVFFSQLQQSLIYEKLAMGAQLMDELGIGLLDPAVIDERPYVTNEGRWDFAFSGEYRRRLIPDDDFHLADLSHSFTNEQIRVANLVYSDIHEPLHVQGYAGTGKSFLIRALLDVIESKGIHPEQVLLLAQTEKQLQGLKRQLPEKYTFKTFGQLAGEILPQDLTKPGYRRLKKRSSPNDTLTFREVERYFGLGDMASLTGVQIAQAMVGSIFNYCQSADVTLQHKHLPKWVKTNPSPVLDFVVQRSEDLWQQILQPVSPKFIPPVRAYHQIKLASLANSSIPNSYSYVLVDESHDLTASMLQIIDGSPQCCISMGDSYQNLGGGEFRRSHLVRERQMTQSFRAGALLDDVVNPIIESHPLRLALPFQGKSDIDTFVAYYHKLEIPPQPSAILVSDEWALWEWSQRLFNANLAFCTISYFADLNSFVNDVLELKHHGTKPRHRLLSGITDWSALAQRYQYNRGFQRISQMIERRYSLNDWVRVCAAYQDSHSGNQVYILGKAEDARNQEFDRLMITPDVVDLVWGKDRANLAGPGSILYVAVTRVRYELTVPASLRDWIEEIQST